MIEALLISLGINFVLFILAYSLQTDKLTDFAYSLSFAALAIVGVLSNDVEGIKYLLPAFVLLWAFRLATYLVVRIKKMGHDKRFDEMRSSFFRFGGFWLLQAVTAWVVLIPTLLALNSDKRVLINDMIYIGLAVAVTGLVIEAVSDQQKFKFISNKKNKGKWIESGLWKYSRHPNYFGEILVWIGMYMAASPWLTSTQTLIAFVSPAMITVLLMFVSGIPLLEKAADKKWGKDKKYQEYKRTTSILFILPKMK